MVPEPCTTPRIATGPDGMTEAQEPNDFMGLTANRPSSFRVRQPPVEVRRAARRSRPGRFCQGSGPWDGYCEFRGRDPTVGLQWAIGETKSIRHQRAIRDSAASLSPRVPRMRPLDGLDGPSHLVRRRRVCRVNEHPGRRERPGNHGLLDPQEHIVSGASFVVAEIVVQADLRYPPLLEQRDRLVRPVHSLPAGGSRSLVV